MDLELGENGSGKSTLLRALSLALVGVEGLGELLEKSFRLGAHR